MCVSKDCSKKKKEKKKVLLGGESEYNITYYLDFGDAKSCELWGESGYIPFGDVKSCEQCGASDRREGKACHEQWGPPLREKGVSFSYLRGSEENSPNHSVW